MSPRHPEGDLTAYLDGALPAARAEEIRRHLDGCADCRYALARLRSAVALLGKLPAAPAPSPAFAARLEARLAPERERRRGWSSRLLAWRWRIAIPAGALAAAAAALIAVVSVRDGRARDRAIAEHLELLSDYEAVAALDAVETPEDAAVVAHLQELGKEAAR